MPAVCASLVRWSEAVSGPGAAASERAMAAVGRQAGLPKLPNPGLVCEAEIRTIHVDTDERRVKIALVLTLSGESI